MWPLSDDQRFQEIRDQSTDRGDKVEESSVSLVVTFRRFF